MRLPCRATRKAWLGVLSISAAPGLLRGAAALNCFSEMNFGWCEFSRMNPGDAPHCPDYVFSIAGFQRKLDAHYNRGGRPPLMEAFFLIRLHESYQEMLINQDCPNPLVFAHLLVSEMFLISPPWDKPAEGWELYNKAMDLAKGASPFQQHLMIGAPPAWPLRKAMDQVHQAAGLAEVAGELRSAGARHSVHFVVAHCREDLGWIGSKLGLVPPDSHLAIYEKCGQSTATATLPGASKFVSAVAIPRPDEGGTRGDECSAYLTHIVSQYESLADFTVFLQSDPHEHLHFDFLDLVLRSIAGLTYQTSFLPLNGPRHVRTLTPCLQAVHEELFGTNLSELIGPYCCAQFVVSSEAIRKHGLSFYQNMLSLVDGTRQTDLCGVEGTKRSTQCYGYEFLWHMIFGESADPPYREDDARLPVALRLKHGKEHTRLNWIGVPLARDIPLKIVPDVEHGNPLVDEAQAQWNRPYGA